MEAEQYNKATGDLCVVTEHFAAIGSIYLHQGIKAVLVEQRREGVM